MNVWAFLNTIKLLAFLSSDSECSWLMLYKMVFKKMTKKIVVLWIAILFAVLWELEIGMAGLPFIISYNSFLSWTVTLSNQNSPLTF